jgi:two-component system response regulator HydG
VSDPSIPVVVVVDDDPSHRRLVGRWIERSGYQVREFADAASLLSSLDHMLPDAVLLDVHMEGMSGLAALERLKRLYPHLPVLMLTADANVPTAVQAIQQGAYDYLTKPVERSKLLTVLRNAVKKHAMAARLRQLERELRGGGYGGIIGSSSAMRRLFKQLDRVSPSDVTVLIAGESGTGKELVARAIHANSGRARGPFVPLNCAAIAETLQESELFGHEKGSFTGATSRRVGRFEQAHGGTLFLDEVGELSAGLQAKLLRVLQERKFYRLGGSEQIEVDVRIVTATHRDLQERCLKGDFREDLFYRLAVFELELPPLRDRTEDIPLLAQTFLERFAKRHGRPEVRIGEAAMAALREYHWPGNVRELQNAVERALVATLEDEVQPEDLPRRVRDPGSVPTVLSPAVSELQPMEELERRAIQEAIRAAEGNMSEVIRRLGIPRTTLYRKLKKYQLR